MEDLKIGDWVMNEYGHIGRIVSIDGIEVEVDVIDYMVAEDIDICNLYKCRLATEQEIENVLSYYSL